MTSPAVVPGSAARVSRTAAGRRALQLALLAGGLLALGLLCGGRAQAAEGTPSAPAVPSLTAVVGRLGVEKLLPHGETAREEKKATPLGTPPRAISPRAISPRATAPHVTPAHATSPRPTAPRESTAREVTAREAAVREATARATPREATVHKAAPHKPVTHSTPTRSTLSSAPTLPTAPTTPTAPVARTAPTAPAVRTAPSAPTLPTALVAPVVPVVGETVRSVTVTVTGVVTQGLGDVAQQVSELPAELATLPVRLPTLPTLPALPGTSTTPPVSEPPGESLPVPVTSAPGTTEPHPAVTDGGRQQTSRTKKPAATVGPYGPQGTVVALAPVSGTAAHTHPGGRRAAHTFDVPSHPAPTGDPDGTLGKPVVDGSSSRHGDAYAVTFDDRAPLRLVPGAAARVHAAGTRDRYRDIPVFPG
ncbi:hypothetical protein [Streptomyces sp. NPDC058683]|uniref:hypothetical protein n=1 Tax=Streptomyces sp. NPDC058683 TaxID=3346597 RepID=UPI0036625F0B